MTYPLAHDPNGDVADEYGLFGLPTTIFVAPDGRIVGKEIGQLHPASLAFGLARLEAASHR